MSNDKKFKGTPGPWDAHCMHGDARIGSNGEAIAVAPRHADQKNWPKSANARLIAAAPDLLEALQALDKAARKIASWNGLDIADADEQFDGIFERSETAIAKAIGE